MRPDIAADMTWLELAPRRALAHIAFSVSKLQNNSSFETEKERMMAWVNRDACMERLWALDGTRDIEVIAGDAPLRQVRAHEGALRLRCSEEPVF